MPFELTKAHEEYVPSVGVLTPPKPKPNTHYIGAAIDPAHADSVFKKVAMGYEVVSCKDAVVLGFSDRPFKQGGLLDKTNNWVTNGDTVLMETSFENATKLADMRLFRAAQIKGLKEDEFQELSERLDAAYKVAA